MDIYYAIKSGCEESSQDYVIDAVFSLLLSHRTALKKEVIGTIGAKLLDRRSPQIVLDAYFEVANEELENNETENETNN